MVKRRLVEQSLNVHSLDRDLEFKIDPWKGGSCGERRMNHEEMENSKGRKSVLLEKTNCLHEEHYRDEGATQHLLGGPFWKFSAVPLKKNVLEHKKSAFTEVKRMKRIMENSKKVEEGNGESFFGRNGAPCSPSSAFSFVWPTRAPGEPKSAFSKPGRALAVAAAAAAAFPLGVPVKGPGRQSGCVSAADLVQCRSLLSSTFLASDLHSSRLLQAAFLRNDPFLYSSEMWPRQVKGQMQAMPASSSSPTLTLLPPTFTSFGVSAQNWCAKCNLSFRMTSDLVLHMRSHHKKERPSPESQGKRRQEEKLPCPVCQEYFRERHHLSRHMTSHN